LVVHYEFPKLHARHIFPDFCGQRRPVFAPAVGQDPCMGSFRISSMCRHFNSPIIAASPRGSLHKVWVTTVTLTFSAPVYAWGANFYDAQSSELETMALTDTGDNLIADVPVTVTPVSLDLLSLVEVVDEEVKMATATIIRQLRIWG